MKGIFFSTQMTSVVENLDCMIGMKEFPDKWFDLAVVDPEYRDENQPDKNMRSSGSMKNWKGAPKEGYFLELFRISKNQIIWGGNYFTWALESNNNWLVWYKNNDGTHMSMAEMAWVSVRKNVKVFDFRPMGHNVDWHPTAKPIKLYDYIYQTYLPEGGKVIDTHLGSGSNRIAADKAGNIDFVGYELDKDYYEAQEKRWKNYKAQLTMF
jgi:site-specific DNA-methyltransferase (adenine-specific)